MPEDSEIFRKLLQLYGGDCSGLHVSTGEVNTCFWPLLYQVSRVVPYLVFKKKISSVPPHQCSFSRMHYREINIKNKREVKKAQHLTGI